MVGHPRGCPTDGGRPPPPVKERRWSATPGGGRPRSLCKGTLRGFPRGSGRGTNEVSGSSPPRRAQTQRIARTTAAHKCRPQPPGCRQTCATGPSGRPGILQRTKWRPSVDEVRRATSFRGTGKGPFRQLGRHQGGTREAPGRQERTNGTACEAPGRQERINWTAREAPGRHQGGRKGPFGQPGRHQGGRKGLIGQPAKHQGGTREAGKDQCDSPGGARGKERTYWTAREAPGRQERTKTVPNGLPS